jgi:transcriptional regulator with XRE-family HTH domain
MNARQRAAIFSHYVGLELKGKITAQGFTAKAVAEAASRSPAAFNRWLNGRVELPLTVLCEACEIIGVEPAFIVDVAYSRLVMEHGGRETRTEDDPVGETGGLPIAAKKGRRKADVDHAE